MPVPPLRRRALRVQDDPECHPIVGRPGGPRAPARDRGGHRDRPRGPTERPARRHRLAAHEPGYSRPRAALPARVPAAGLRCAERHRPGATGEEFFTQYGDAPRRYRNGLGLAIPGREPVDTLRRATRYLKAIALLKGRRQEFNLTSGQVNQLNQRETTEKTAFESAIRDLYASVWLPVFSEAGLATEKVGLAGRPLQATTVHERLSELLTVVSPPRLFNSLRPGKIVELLRLGVGADENRAVGVDQVIAAFYEVPGLPRLQSEAAIRQAIAAGVQERAFGLVGRTGRDETSRLREASGYLVSPRAVQIGVLVPADNIEPASTFIIVPEAIESEAPLNPLLTSHNPPLAARPRHTVRPSSRQASLDPHRAPGLTATQPYTSPCA